MPVGQEGRGLIGRKRPQVQYYKIRLKCTPHQPDFFLPRSARFRRRQWNDATLRADALILYNRCTAVEPAGGCSFCCSSALRQPASRRGRPETGLSPVATGLSPVTTRPIPGFCAAGALWGRQGNMLTRPLSVSGRKRIFAEAIYVRPSALQGASVRMSVPARIFYVR